MGIFLNLSPVTSAQEVAILKSADINAYSEAISAFTSALPSTIQIIREYDLQGDMAKGRQLAQRIRASNVKVVLAVGLKAALAAKLEIPDIPVIFCLVLDPEKYGLPTTNMVGLSLKVPFRQPLKSLHALAPKVSRIGVLFDPQKSHEMHRQLLHDANALGIQILSEEIHQEQDVASALNALKDRIDALWLLPDSTVLTESTLDFLISTTLEANIPVVGFSSALVRSGAVIGAYVHYADIGTQAAQLTQQLARQTPSSVLGTIIPPKRVHQSINQKSARYLGLSLTPDVLRQFDERF
ncbi:ABC transporter substrate-binding protein [Candidatus Nitrospira allomarina]|uniref:ABC transporter substrate binding protein n=1 Tax=Candidatus Nitrospira allomarina TaxID=3020900 RepID=A0AA96JT06_9BACT|nr:ABC transporter substrate binding protein [Candidatus Nitrospira allomarina]WNM59082.1 ABC transporter substrate binding protein [Candidatus Nitrospira allomarina]